MPHSIAPSASIGFAFALCLAIGAVADTPATGPDSAQAHQELGLVLLNEVTYPESGDPAAVCKALIQKGADITVRDRQGDSALEIAQRIRDPDTKNDVLAVLKNPPKPGRDTAAPATQPAGAQGAQDTTAALNGAVSNVIEFPPDDAAALIERLVVVGADPSNQTPPDLLAELASNAGNTWTVSNNDWRRAATALLKAGAKVNGSTGQAGMTPLDSAIDSDGLWDAHNEPAVSRELAMILFLIDHGAKIDKVALSEAADLKDPEVKKKVLDLLNKAK